jgi:hypothetical protein
MSEEYRRLLHIRPGICCLQRNLVFLGKLAQLLRKRMYIESGG